MSRVSALLYGTLNRPPPHPLPAEHCKGQSRKGVGDTVRPATVLSHIVGPLCAFCPPSRRGKCCPFFSFCVFRVRFGVFRLFCRFSLLRVVFEKIFRSELLFLGGVVGLVFFGGFLPMFLLYFLAVRSRKCSENILLMSGLVFFGFVLSSFGFFVDIVFRGFFQKRQFNTPSHAPVLLFLFSFCVPPLSSVSPVLAVRPASWWFFGVPFWAPRVLGFSLNLPRPFSWDARRQGFSWASLALFFFSPCVLFCGHAFFRRTGGGLTNPAGSLTHPSEE